MAARLGSIQYLFIGTEAQLSASYRDRGDVDEVVVVERAGVVVLAEGIGN